MPLETTTSESIIVKLNERGFEIDEITKEWIRIMVLKGENNAYERGRKVYEIQYPINNLGNIKRKAKLSDGK